MKLKRFLFFALLIFSSFLSYSKINISIYEPIRFDDVNTRSLGDVVIGRGTIEVTSDNLEEDLDKKIILRFADSGLLNNGKRWIRVDRFEVEEKNKEFIIKEKSKRITFYAYVQKSELNDTVRNGEDIEGVYRGRLAIVAELYGKPTPIEKKENNKGE